MDRVRLLLVACLVGALASVPVPASGVSPRPSELEPDIADQVRALPGVVAVSERRAEEGTRFFVIRFQQPVDHLHPELGSFRQRLTLLHRSVDRPMVMYTSGYDVSTYAWPAEPTQILDGNQLSMEHRFFEPSRPQDPDWSQQLTIRQAADDQHRVIQAFQQLYEQPWITSGGSKGGMTATYHRRFYPDDVAGTVAYVAPNDVDNDRDVYNRFLSQVGTERCRDDLAAVQRRVLGADRAWFRERTRRAAAKKDLTWRILGSLDRAMEVAVVDVNFTFWQYTGHRGCRSIPGPRDSRVEIWSWLNGVLPLMGYLDDTLKYYRPYYYQAAYQLGWPESYERPLRNVLRHPGAFAAPEFLPDDLHPEFDPDAMADVDTWVRTQSERMLFVYGAEDPWGAEPFRCGSAAPDVRECSVHVVKGGTHSAAIWDLPRRERDQVTAQLLSWAGLPESEKVPRYRPLPAPDQADHRPA